MPAPTVIARVLRGLGVAALVLGVLTFRVLDSARSELRQADALLEQNDVDGALVHYRRAARWYAPGSPYHVQALDRLAGIAKAAEAKADGALALRAHRAIRSSILATRSFYVPEQARLLAADQRIAALMAEEPAPGMDAGKSKEQLRSEHLELLRHDPGPGVLWSVVLLFGFATWVSAAFVFAARAIDEHDRWVIAEARRWGALIVVGFGLFVLGMSLA